MRCGSRVASASAANCRRSDALRRARRALQESTRARSRSWPTRSNDAPCARARPRGADPSAVAECGRRAVTRNPTHLRPHRQLPHPSRRPRWPARRPCGGRSAARSSVQRRSPCLRRRGAVIARAVTIGRSVVLAARASAQTLRSSRRHCLRGRTHRRAFLLHPGRRHRCGRVRQAPDAGRYVKVPQIGSAEIGDDVEVAPYDDRPGGHRDT